MMVVLLFTFALGSIVAAYIYLTRNYNYWRDRNILCAKGTLPGFGHTLPLLVMRTTLVDLVQRICDPYPDRSMVGFYHQTTPALVIREPELVKTVLQTNFASFSRNVWKIDSHLDRLNAANPFFCYGDTWLIGRKHIGLASTTRNIKIFLNCIQQVCNNLENYLNDKLKANNNTIELKINNLAYRYSSSVAAYSGSSFQFQCGKCVLQRRISAKIQDFFFGFIKEIVHIRQQEKNTRKFNFLQLMLDLKETKEIDYNVVTSLVFTLYMNMHDTSTVTLGLAAYQIARHPHVQQKLRDEVRTVLAKYDGQLSYYALKEMTYIDQVINESQRLYPILPCMGKICTEEFELKSSDELSCCINPGTEIFVNVYEIHRNSNYWHNPDVFDPNRFSSDRKTEIEKYTFLPFGEGPKTCVAMRMAMLQTKANLAMIMKNYTLELSLKPPKEPLKFMQGNIVLQPIGGLWVHLKPL
ncbi:PREDICTED: cytochrome P450 6B1-like [Dinoponera quadriceps]|uniref:Cytochrome P450 6B1-like n=1 Tax=Dinoponera quadriceps TaxID=609295 RepID=A0A6P3XDQ0_DINQU|nr:PREDICTED: cytochrome P450 6B1-like [Dinoponera quadriceps]